jgi:hypothetical protein
MKFFLKQLTCELHPMCYHQNINLVILKRKVFTNDDRIFLNDKYDLDDIVNKKVHTNDNNFKYNRSICPIYGFTLENDFMYTSNQYELK